MLSRTIARPSHIAIRCQAAQRAAFGRPPQQHLPFHAHHRQYASSAQEPDEQRNGEQKQPRRGSVRPFTVLFLCIPLGYGINWALKQQYEGQASPDGFVKYVLATKEPVSSTCSIFSLIPSTSNGAINTAAPELARSITSVQFKQPQLQIARSYTLLPRIEGQDEDELRFLIKKEQKGEVSGYLHCLPVDAEIEVRGVSQEYVIPDGVERVVFLAGGTGIAPAMQVANILRGENANMHILWANRNREDCNGGTSDNQSTAFKTSWWDVSKLWSSRPSETTAATASAPLASKHQIVRELDDAKGMRISAGQDLRVDYFVDEEGTFIQPGHVSRLLQDSTPGKKLLIVSGPEGFVSYWAGPKQWLNGREVPGPIAGALGRMNHTDWKVVKL